MLSDARLTSIRQYTDVVKCVDIARYLGTLVYKELGITRYVVTENTKSMVPYAQFGNQSTFAYSHHYCMPLRLSSTLLRVRRKDGQFLDTDIHILSADDVTGERGKLEEEPVIVPFHQLASVKAREWIVLSTWQSQVRLSEMGLQPMDNSLDAASYGSLANSVPATGGPRSQYLS